MALAILAWSVQMMMASTAATDVARSSLFAYAARKTTLKKITRGFVWNAILAYIAAILNEKENET
jgi:hypothetical protein